MTTPKQHRLFMLTLAVLVLAASPLTAHSYGGRAFAAYVHVPTLGVGPLYLADTGSLPAQGGWEGAGSLSETIPGVMTANVMNAVTSGASGNGNSSSSLADLVVFAGQPAELRASFALSEARAGAAGGGGETEVSDLTFGGVPVTVTGVPNQVVTLPGVATLTINEQTISADGNSAVVNALRLTLLTGDQVILGSARSQVDPLGGSQLASNSLGLFETASASCLGSVVPAHIGGEDQCIDFVTGGGHFSPPNSSRPGRVNFGFNAGPRSAQNPTLKGHLNLNDHFDGTHVSGTSVDEYVDFSGDPEHCRLFAGDAKFNGAAGYRYWAGVCDYGEPGRDDRFKLTVTLGGAEVYSVDNFDGTPAPSGGELDGGNIQLHKEKCLKPDASSSSSPTNRNLNV